jgi:hypothetical protein
VSYRITDKPFVSDTRDVSLHLADAPEVRTPAGRLPIRPTWMQLHYSMDGRLWSIEVGGEPTDPKDRERRTYWSWRTGERTAAGVAHVKRRLDVNDLPQWVTEIAEEFRP